MPVANLFYYYTTCIRVYGEKEYLNSFLLMEDADLLTGTEVHTLAEPVPEAI